MHPTPSVTLTAFCDPSPPPTPHPSTWPASDLFLDHKHVITIRFSSGRVTPIYTQSIWLDWLIAANHGSLPAAGVLWHFSDSHLGLTTFSVWEPCTSLLTNQHKYPGCTTALCFVSCPIPYFTRTHVPAGSARGQPCLRKWLVDMGP